MRNISFALTTDQVRNQTKTVTRRLGWAWLTPGVLLQPVVKGMGLKRGEKVERIGSPIRVVSVRREPLVALIQLVGYTFEQGQRDVILEGFPHLDRGQFVRMFMAHNKCDSTDLITRIEFEYTQQLPHSNSHADNRRFEHAIHIDDVNRQPGVR
jgi:hypothetical protein